MWILSVGWPRTIINGVVIFSIGSTQVSLTGSETKWILPTIWSRASSSRVAVFYLLIWLLCEDDLSWFYSTNDSYLWLLLLLWLMADLTFVYFFVLVLNQLLKLRDTLWFRGEFTAKVFWLIDRALHLRPHVKIMVWVHLTLFCLLRGFWNGVLRVLVHSNIINWLPLIIYVLVYTFS